MTSDGSINVKVGFKELGLPDPNPNKQKQLKVDYTINGSPSTDIINDGQRFKISAPALEGAGDGKTPTQHVNSLIGSVFAGAAKFVGIFVYTSSVLLAYDFGNYFIHPMLWGAIAFFIPAFGFWGLPFVVFFFRLFRSSNIVPMYTASAPPA